MNNTIKLFSPIVVFVVCVIVFTSCSLNGKSEDYEQPFSLGEGMTYRSRIFEVKKPTLTPFPVHVNDKYAYSRYTHNTHSEWCTEAIFDFAKPITEDLGAVKVNGKWGYIKIDRDIEQGYQFVIEPKYESAEPFSEGLAAVKLNNKYGYINKDDEMVIEPEFLSAHYFSGGLAAVETEEGWIFINTSGERVFNDIYECAESFAVVYTLQDGQYVANPEKTFAPVKINGKWGYINLRGEVAIEPKFDEAWVFDHDGRAAVKINNKWKYINMQGEIIGNIY